MSLRDEHPEWFVEPCPSCLGKPCHCNRVDTEHPERCLCLPCVSKLPLPLQRKLQDEDFAQKWSSIEMITRCVALVEDPILAHCMKKMPCSDHP